MSPVKPAAKPPKKKGTASPKSGPKSRRGLWLLLLLLLVAVTFTTFFYLVFLHDGKWPGEEDQARTTPQQAPSYQESMPSVQLPVPTTKPSAQKPTPKAAPPEGPADKPRLAIIIDDLGQRTDTGKALIAIDLPLSFAFLPNLPHTSSLLAAAKAKGRDTLLHLPLEATDPKWDPGPGALTTGMDEAAIRHGVEAALAATPGVTGVNNHMGSRFTADPEAMRRLLTVVRDRRLFFFDSVTAANSTAYDLAVKMGVPTGRRQVFLDNEQDVQKIIGQLELLVRSAEQNGQAVGIGHPYPATVEAIRRYRPELLRRTRMVGVSRLVR